MSDDEEDQDGEPRDAVTLVSWADKRNMTSRYVHVCRDTYMWICTVHHMTLCFIHDTVLQPMVCVPANGRDNATNCTMPPIVWGPLHSTGTRSMCLLRSAPLKPCPSSSALLLWLLIAAWHGMAWDGMGCASSPALRSKGLGDPLLLESIYGGGTLQNLNRAPLP